APSGAEVGSEKALRCSIARRHQIGAAPRILSRCARSTYRTMWRWNGTPHRASFNREDRLATRYLLDRRESKNDLYRRSLLEKAKRHFHCGPLACQPTDSGLKQALAHGHRPWH